MSWKEKWSQEKSENLPKTAISSLEKCDKTFFPNIYILLKLLAVVPVSVATVERSFSSLRRLKTYLRNTTSERTFLAGLTVLCGCPTEYEDRCTALLYNLLASFLQLLTALIVVGWVWSIMWGITFVGIS
ncbi:hypothetical protein AVEN_68204-1, partial [Araneus ventricosus]